MIDQLRDGPIPHRVVGDGRLQVMDLSLLPGAWKGTVFDGEGYFIESAEIPESVPAEPSVSAIVGGVIEPRDKSAVVEKSLQGKLPEDFPGFAALAAADIHTYAQVRNAGEVTAIPGIGDATAGKIAEAMKG